MAMTETVQKRSKNGPKASEIPENRRICLVPGCRRYTDRFPHFVEWICGRHWTAIPAPTRKRHRDLQSKVEIDPGLQLICRTELDRNWRACVDAAVQAAAGL